MSLRDAYVAGMLHDVKKMLLSRDNKRRNEYASWSADHLRLNVLEKDSSMAGDLLDNYVKLENEDQILLVNLHQGSFDEEALQMRIDDPRLLEIDTVSVISLIIADIIHKSLYFPEAAYDESFKTGMQFPFFYPFYGDPVVWSSENPPNPEFNNRFRFSRIPIRNARLDKFREFQKSIKKEKSLTAKYLVDLQKSIFSDFPDTTYLPITSIGFHHRFTTAILFIIQKALSGFELNVGEIQQKVNITFFLNTIISPPEKLTNRLKDTETVRKISHLLQYRLHKHMSRYLRDLDELGFGHPDQNPFFFYNKDAIVLINDGNDQDRVRKICLDVAKNTESVIRIDSRKIGIVISLTLKKPLSLPIKLEQLKLEDIQTKEGKLKIDKESNPEFVPDVRAVFLPPAYSKSTESDKVEQMHCYVCNKPSITKEDYFNKDLLCQTCLTMRKNFPRCKHCSSFFFKGDVSDLCPYDRQKLDFRHTSNLLNTRSVIRVAYILISTNCSYTTIRTDAEALMARYRYERYEFDNRRKNRILPLSMAGSTDYNVFEYLQAVLDITRFQQDLQDIGIQDENFLYRSPINTLILLPEDDLMWFFRKMEPLVNKLNIIHKIGIVTCTNNHPVWMVLHALKIHDSESPAIDSVRDMAEKLNEASRALRKSRIENPQNPASDDDNFINQSNDFYDSYQAYKLDSSVPDHLKCKELKLTIHRSGIERIFNGRLAYFLLKERHESLVLFRIANREEYVGVLDSGDIPNEMEKGFRSKRISLDRSYIVNAITTGYEWSIQDRIGKYIVRNESDKLIVYRSPGTKAIASQLNHLSSFASGLISELNKNDIDDSECISFQKNMLLEIDSRAKWDGNEKIDESMANELRNLIAGITPQNLLQFPGLLREIGAYKDMGTYRR